MPSIELENKIADIIRSTPLLRPADGAHIAASITAKLREIFLEAVPETQAELAHDQSNILRITRTVHKLKGAAGFVGATRLWTLAADFEQTAERLTADELQHYVGVIKEVLRDTESQMKRLMAGQAR